MLKFGTDGIRGAANSELTPELALSLGVAAARVLGTPGEPFLVGRDTRLSGPMIQAALSAGLASGGVNVVDLGVTPTPAVAHMSAVRSAPGAVISASHNPFGDNGIKFFLPGGQKLSDNVEDQLEAALHDMAPRLVGAAVGGISSDYPAAYEHHLMNSVGGVDLSRMHVVLDCANGASSAIASDVFEALGMRVTVLSNEPDGMNINDNCGSTHPEVLQHVVVASRADAGFAFDGDADRVLAADHTGALVDGDHLLGLLAVQAKRDGTLKDDTLVITVMANLGLKLAMEAEGISVHETQVGDRYVLEALSENGWSLGGEQSGHVIFPALATTGDGMLTALQVLSVMARNGESLQSLASVVSKLPQILRNVRVANKDALTDAAAVWAAVEAEQAQLGNGGRVLLRTSGTEPMVRVMVEAPTQAEADDICERLCRIVESELS